MTIAYWSGKWESNSHTSIKLDYILSDSALPIQAFPDRRQLASPLLIKTLFCKETTTPNQKNVELVTVARFELAILALKGRCLNQTSTIPPYFTVCTVWCQRRESNSRPFAYEATVLPLNYSDIYCGNSVPQSYVITNNISINSTFWLIYHSNYFIGISPLYKTQWLDSN